MLVSVALATYNGARYLTEQLDSIAKQTLRPAELVISDDGSTDETLAIVSAFANTAPFLVRILPRERRRGFADNFLYCAGACNNELVAFCDQDDVWLPEKLAVSHARLEADDSLLAIHRLTTTSQTLEPQGTWTQGIEGDSVWAPLSLDPYINGWGNTMLFRRFLVDRIAYDGRPRQPESTDRPMSHDFWIYVLAAALGRISHIAEPLILYRQHDKNAIGVEQTGKRKPARDLAMQKLRQRMVFYQHMEHIFRDLAAQDGQPFRLQAAAAAATYADRAAPLVARFAIYESPSFAGRLQAFAAMSRTHPLAFKSQVKDFLFGVSGLHGRLG
ncbi:MAG TPA: glycosyltransferase family 2 protein [Acidisoma sp.]|uniref:glycosyltransferase family 2 protein n=1 Tax=Acidisoma sp. TaxID=1872115 RepID=UPI002BA4E41E|nr:glycosyltransferase family 2 protein [Acidisoma sp.]HTI02375.1 glycosyltransferase family 2 protein [Acidisoma sp.]